MGVPRTARKRGACLCGRSAHGNATDGGTRGKVITLWFWSARRANRDTHTDACQRRFDGLMAQMADWASVSGGVGMMMPDSPERRAYDQRE
jgi:hypothetical protein